MLKLYINSQEADIDKEAISYTKQGNNIADLQSREANHTNSFSLPKTANNIQVLEGLGLVGDTSSIPYSKTDCQLTDNGNPLLTNGWLKVKNTNKEFKVSIQNGLIDLYKAIENKTFGEDVDLSEIDHQKDLNTIIASFTNPNYRYIINDYGGKTHTDTGEINIDYLVPSVSVNYLWNKIFTTFGFNYLGNIFSNSDFTDLWLTYPKGLNNISETFTQYADLQDWNGTSFDNISLTTGLTPNNEYYEVVETGAYLIDFEGSVRVFEGNSTYIVASNLLINGLSKGTYSSQQLNLNQGDKVSLSHFSPQNGYTEPIGGFITVSKYDNLVSFSEELKGLSVKDFFKEILWLFGLTIFTDIDGNYIFKTFDERLESGYVDWSEKYVNRTNESYIPKTYGQINNFIHKYNDNEDDFNDGSFSIVNENLKESTTVINSNIYSHEKEPLEFVINSSLTEIFNPTLLYKKEVKETNGVQSIEYKPLSKRFHYLRSQTVNTISTTLANGFSSQNVSSLPVARLRKTTFKDFVADYYSNIKLALNDFRLHTFELALNTIDFINLDFDKVYYFSQEQNYYLLNKATFKKGTLTKAEFYRIKYTENFGTYYNTEQSIVFTKNDCPIGFVGSDVPYVVLANTYSSVLNQTEADNLAINEANTNGQAFANANGTCTVLNYSNVEQSQIFTRDNCPSGFVGGNVTYVVLANTYTSTVSQADADNLALNHINTNGQNYANTNGSCDQITYYNTEQSQTFTKNDCITGFTGSSVTYTVNANTYSSIISQADANNQAFNDISINGQAFANANGTCTSTGGPI